MNAVFSCPNCKNPLVNKSTAFFCSNCNRDYPVGDGYVDFIGENVEFYAGEVPQDEMQKLLNEIDNIGYAAGTVKFFKEHAELRNYVGEFRRSDWICHCLQKRNNIRCLDIGSGLGNISEMLSHLYQEVYSLEAVKERLEFQKRRYKNSKRSNIILARGNASSLPFQDNFFDLVVCNGLLEWIGMMNTDCPPRQAQLSFLLEVKRILSPRGCLYVGIENRIGLPFLLGARDHSGLPYTSFMPRMLASFVVKRFGQSGGLYGPAQVKKREERGYFTYTYTIRGYRSLLNEAGFKFKTYWVFPSYNIPIYSGRIDDGVGLKGFVKYFTSNIAYRYKIALSVLTKVDKSLMMFLASVLSPSFLFYCYKSELQESFDDLVTVNTRIANYTTISLGSGIMYLLFDKKGNPLKLVRLKRRGSALPDSLPHLDKSSPNSTYLKQTERAWIEDWMPGRKLNPLSLMESQLAIEWLISFQKQTSSMRISKNSLVAEVNSLRATLRLIPDLDTLLNHTLIKNYESYIITNSPTTVSEHGDFFYGNIIFDSSSDKISVIDWEYFKEMGDPFFDFVWFIINSMMLPSNSHEEFQANMEKRGSFKSIMEQLLSKVNCHFGFELDLDILIPYVLLRALVRKYIERGRDDEVVINLQQLLVLALQKKNKVAG